MGIFYVALYYLPATVLLLIAVIRFHTNQGNWRTSLPLLLSGMVMAVYSALQLQCHPNSDESLLLHSFLLPAALACFIGGMIRES